MVSDAFEGHNVSMEGLNKRTIRKEVSENDPAYIEARKRSQDAYSDRVFGRGAASIFDNRREMIEETRLYIDQLKESLTTETDPERVQYTQGLIEREQERTAEIDREKADPLRREFNTLTGNLFKLIALEPDSNRKKYVIQEVREMFRAPEIQDELQALLGDNTQKFFGGELDLDLAHDFSMLSARRLFSEDLLYTVAIRHSERVAAQEAMLAELAERTKEEFKGAVIAAVERGLLPEQAARSLDRLNSIPIELSDRLASILSNTLGENHDSGKVTVSGEQLQPDLIPRLRRTLFHEFLHEISGRSITVTTETNEKWDAPLHLSRRKKSGVSLHGASFYSPNRWLNEAITEWLALELSGYNGDEGKDGVYKGSRSYAFERKELDRLFEAGLQRKSVTAAYFENIVSGQEEPRGEHFSKLIGEINRMEGRFGFTKLENAHLMHEIEYECNYQSIYPSEFRSRLEDVYPLEKTLQIHIDVGSREEVRVSEDFVYGVHQYPPEYELPTEKQIERVSRFLAALEAKYHGKVHYSLREISRTEA
jgi:hypothetical protein